MINFEQIKEIKRKITHARMTIMQAYNSLTFIEEIDLEEVKELSAEHFLFFKNQGSSCAHQDGIKT